MKNSRFDTINSLKSSNVKSSLDLSKIKTTDINILLNKIRIDKKKDFNKKIIFFSLIIIFLFLTLLITYI